MLFFVIAVFFPPDILSRLKISCLEASRDEAKRKKLSHKKVYVSQCLGKPLDKLSVCTAWYGVYLVDMAVVCTGFL